MRKITKKQEAMLDLKRYKKQLPDQENYEDRLLFIRGIVNLDPTITQLSNDTLSWKTKQTVYESLENYSRTQLSRLCCVDIEDIRAALKGHGDESTLKQIYAGVKYGS